jgi:hypothetical protein
VPDPFAYNRRITKAFEQMDAAKQLEKLNFPRNAIHQLAQQQVIGGPGGFTNARDAVLEAGARLGANGNLPSNALRSLKIGRTFDLTGPNGLPGEAAYNRRITKAFEQMDAAKQLEKLNFPRNAIHQLAQQSLGGLQGLTAGRRAVLEAGATLDQIFPRSRNHLLGLQDFVERAKSTSNLLLRREIVEEELAEADPISARLAVLLGHVGVGKALQIMELMLAEGRDALLSLLGRVLLSPDSLEVFSRAVEEAPLSRHVELDLRHALEHLVDGDTSRAFPPLITGLEGALRDSARARGNFRKPKSARGVAAALKMKKDHEHLIGDVYKVTNDGRHGEDLDREVGCVLGLVGLVVWMDDCLDQPAVKWLGRRLEQERLSVAA